MFKKIAICLVVLLAIVSNAYSDDTPQKKLRVELLTAQYHLNGLNRALADFPESECIVRNPWSELFILSNYHGNGPLYESSKRLKKQGYEASSIGKEIEHICLASAKDRRTLDFGTDNDALALRDVLQSRVAIVKQRIDALLNSADEVANFLQSIEDDSSLDYSNDTSMSLLGTEQTAAIANTEAKQTLSVGVKENLLDARDTFQELARRANKIDENDAAAREYLINQIRSEASFYSSWSRVRYIELVDAVNGAMNKEDTDEAVHYIHKLAEVNKLAEQLENAKNSKKGLAECRKQLEALLQLTNSGNTKNSTEDILRQSSLPSFSAGCSL